MATTNWKAGSGNWSTAANWDSGVPTSSVDAVVNNASQASPVTVTFNSATGAAHSLYMGSFTTLTMTSGALTLSALSTLQTLNVATGSTLDLQAGANVYGLTTETGGTIEVDSGHLAFQAGGSFSGALTGAGTIDFNGNATYAINAGATITANRLTMLGGSTTLTLGENLTFAKSWQENAGTIALGGHTLTLTGNAGLHGTVNGSGKVVTSKPVSVDGLTLGGSAVLENKGLATQSSSVTLGDGNSSTALLQNDATGTYDIKNDSYIYSNGLAQATNAGLFEKTGGTGTSVIYAAFTNTGTVSVTTGTIDFVNTDTFGGTITGLGDFELGGSVIHTINSGAVINVQTLTVGDNAATTVSLNENLNFGNSYYQNGNSHLLLNGNTLTLSGAGDLHGAIAGSGLVLANGSVETDYMQLGGSVTLDNTGFALQTGGIVYLGDGSASTAVLQNAAGGTYDIAGDGDINVNGGTSITNAGLLEKTAGINTSEIDPNFTNTGTVEVDSGILYLHGSSTLGGTIQGNGTLWLGGSTSVHTIAVGGTVTIANLVVGDYGTDLKLAENLTYAGAFTTANGTTLDLGNHLLTLTGNDGLHYIVTGSGRVLEQGTVSLDGLLLNGTGTLENAGTALMASSIYVSSDGVSTPTLKNDLGHVFKITDDSSIWVSGGGKFVNAGLFVKTGGGTSGSYVDPAFTNTGTIEVDTGYLEFRGTDTYLGRIIGNGTVLFGGGHVHTVKTGAITVANLHLVDSGTTLDLVPNLTYAGTFTQDGNTTLNLGTATLTLTHASGLHGLVNGSGRLVSSGPLSVDSMTLGGSDVLEVKGTALENNNIAIGDGAASTAVLQIDATGVFDITDDSSIYQNGGTSINNAGLLERTGGTPAGTSYVDPNLTSTGAIDVDIGYLDFRGADSFTGTIEGGGTIAFGGTHIQTIGAGTTVSVANLYVTDSTDLALGESIAYAGHLTETGSATIDLGTGTLTLNGTSTLRGLLIGSGTLLADAPLALDSMTIGAADVLENASTAVISNSIGVGSGTISTAVLRNDASGTINIINNSYIYATGSPQMTNAGLLEKTGAQGISYIYPNFVNTGTINVLAGGMDFQGTDTFGGTIAGTGTVYFGGGHSDTIATGAVLTTASAYLVDGGTTLTLNENLAYTGHFTQNNSTTLALSAHQLTLSNTSALHGLITGSGKIVSSGLLSIDSMTIGGSATVENKGVMKAANSIAIGDTATSTAVLQNDAGATIDITTDLNAYLNGTGQISNAGLFEKTGGLSTTNIYPAFTNTGTVALNIGGMSFLGGFVNSGKVVSSTGTLYLGGTLSGTGSVQLSNSSLVEVANAGPSTQTFSFLDTTDVLKLDTPGSFASAINGMAAGDLIDLTGTPVTNLSYNATTHILTVTNTGTTEAQLHINGSFTTANFGFTPDSAGGNYISVH